MLLKKDIVWDNPFSANKLVVTQFLRVSLNFAYRHCNKIHTRVI